MHLYKWEQSFEEFAEMSCNDFYKIHQAIWALFGNRKSERKFLYRVLSQKNTVTVLIRSFYPITITPTTGKIYSKILNAVLIKGRYQLSATLNPIIEKSRVSQGKNNSARVPLIHEQDIKKWLSNLLDKKGFKTEKIETTPVYNSYSRIKKATISTCNALGIVEIFDELKALEAFENGIGKERSFGYGMLCLTSLKDSITSSDEDEDYTND
jgi:CRISPR-associated protein Cas6/Cse3/CasE, subtype I-E/ECOLI